MAKPSSYIPLLSSNPQRMRGVFSMYIGEAPERHVERFNGKNVDGNNEYLVIN
jgi:hypothetical protein